MHNIFSHKNRKGVMLHVHAASRQGGDPQSHVQDKKLVSIRPSAKTGRTDYTGGGLSAADQEMYGLFGEDR